jgi:hypothetical protein
MATGDPENHCYFAEDGETDPRALCTLDWADSVTARYPRLNGPPIDSGACGSGFVCGN